MREIQPEDIRELVNTDGGNARETAYAEGEEDKMLFPCSPVLDWMIQRSVYEHHMFRLDKHNAS